jgi:hypothetical protein
VFGTDMPMPAPKAKGARDAEADAFVQLAVAEAPVVQSTDQLSQVALPVGSTPAEFLALLGLLLASLSLIFRGIALRPRQTVA